MRDGFNYCSPGWLKSKPMIIVRIRYLHRIVPLGHGRLGLPESLVGDMKTNKTAAFCFGFT